MLLGLSAWAAASDSLRIDPQMVFEGRTPGGTVPIAVNLQNAGSDARGVLTVSSDGLQTDYPVELPRGANKRVIVYPEVRFDEVHLSLNTDQGRVEKTFPAPAGTPGLDEQATYVLLISDLPGSMSFITGEPSSTVQTDGSPNNSSAVYPCYSKPGEGPTRPIGYSGVSVIVLGAGAERLTDEEVQAIRSWVSTGGTVVFLGGVSAPVLSDRRWADMLPARNLRLAQLARSTVLTNLGTGAENSSKAQVAPATTVMSGTLAAGATGRSDNGVLVWADLPHGFGRAVYLSFNPFEAPLDKWDGRRMAVSRLIRSVTGLLASKFLQQYVDTGASAYPGGPPVHSSIEEDPFSMRLPSTGQIAVILGAYLLVVVPLNFLVLKKLRRGELAWFTAPVISLAFAGILFKSAGGLYGAKLSTVSNGIVVAQDGDSDGMYIGNTQMFIPHAGSYDLKLKNVDALGSMPEQDYPGGRSGTQMQELKPVDLGEVEVPDMDANNLSFRRLSYRQKAPISKWFRLRLQPTGPESATCEVVNSSPYTISGASLAFGHKQQSIGDLAPGERKSFPISFRSDGDTSDLSNDDVRLFTVKKKRVALTGSLAGFRPGPQIGVDIPGRSDVRLVLFSSSQGGNP